MQFFLNRKLLTLAVLAAGSLPGWSQHAPRRGADVPFITYEAEAARGSGKPIAVAGLPTAESSSPEAEASGRAYRQLSARGDFVEFTPIRAANGLVIRFCIPDAPTGGGITAPLSLYVNGKFRQSISLNSRHAWLYGQTGENGQSNDPTQGQAHVFWDEARFIIKGGLRRGDTLRFQKDAADTADYYSIDLVDLEAVPKPLSPPKTGTYLSIKDFGARGDDDADDTAAITHCIEAAKTAGKTVWFPAGIYKQSAKFTLDGVKVKGAGMWHSAILGTSEGKNWFGDIGFQMDGDGPSVSDLYIDSVAHTSRSDGGKPFTGSAKNWRIENVWITHTITGVWLDGPQGIIQNCRVRSTYADAINLNNGARDNLIQNNHVRGCGDDGIAILSETELKRPPSLHNIVRFNTVSAIWWGHNCDIAGGSGHLVEDNVFADNARMGCFTINQPGAFPMNPLTDTIIRRNSIIRGGGNYVNQKRGAVWIYPGSTTCTNILIQDNQIIDPVFRGIHLTGGCEQGITFERNLIVNPGEEGIYIEWDVKGSTTLLSNTVKNLPPGGKALESNAKPEFVIKQTGNSWQ